MTAATKKPVPDEQIRRYVLRQMNMYLAKHCDEGQVREATLWVADWMSYCNLRENPQEDYDSRCTALGQALDHHGARRLPPERVDELTQLADRYYLLIKEGR